MWYLAPHHIANGMKLKNSINPYNGKILMIIFNPFSYVKHTKSKGYRVPCVVPGYVNVFLGYTLYRIWSEMPKLYKSV